MSKRLIKVGLDFDGVLAYNPWRLVRAPIKWFKGEVLGITRLKFFIPKTKWEEFLMKFYYWGSVWPGKGLGLIAEMAKSKRVKFVIISGRFPFGETGLNSWIKSQGLEKNVERIYVNSKLEQPHLYKQRLIEELKLDYFVEDNLDVVLHLTNHLNIKTKIYWIYNLVDARKNYNHKFPYLELALRKIQKDEGII